jgi:hypothetical protein
LLNGSRQWPAVLPVMLSLQRLLWLSWDTGHAPVPIGPDFLARFGPNPHSSCARWPVAQAPHHARLSETCAPMRGSCRYVLVRCCEAHEEGARLFAHLHICTSAHRRKARRLAGEGDALFNGIDW